jgi:SAM-dependent methyltransferase
MYPQPYVAIREQVVEVLQGLISKDDPYHYKHARRFARTLEVILDQKPSGKLLEVGTSGVLPKALEILAPDVEVHVTEYANKSSVGLYDEKYPSYRGNLEKHNLQVEDETFSFIICSEVVEHMEQDPMAMLAELNKVAKPNAKLVLTTPNITSSRNISKMLRGLDPYFYMQYRKSGSTDRHNYEYTVFSIAKLLNGAGFTGSAWTEDTFELPKNEDILKLRAMGYPIKHVGDNIFCVAQKEGPVVDRYPSPIYQD